MGTPEIKEVSKVLRSGWLFRYGWPGEGWTRQVERFEEAVRRQVRVPYAVATTSGTASLMTAMAALGVGKGDEVIVPGYTFMATPLAVLAVGAVPIVADIDDALGLDPEDVKRKITRRTKAIIPVHMAGLVANLGPILKTARRKRIWVIEDCCQATGGYYRGRPLGSWGDSGAFSYNHYKTISAGEGGAVTLKDRKHFERAMLYMDSGAFFFSPKMRHLSVKYFAGMNFRMSEVIGAVLNAQMKRLPRIVRTMNRIKRRMYAALEGHPLCPPAPVIDLKGDCGKALVLRLADPGTTRRLAAALDAKGLSIQSWFKSLESDRHIYRNWWPVMRKNGHFDPRQDPYKVTPAGRAVRYSMDMCPRTIDLLSRSIGVAISPGWSRAKVDSVVSTIEKTARTI